MATRSIPAVAECYAERALAELVNKYMRTLRLRIRHRPRRGGHDRVIVTTLRGLPGHEILVLFIDYEEGRASAAYTEQLCREKRATLYRRRGAAILLCKTTGPGGRRVYSIVWSPRSEEALEALAGARDSGDPKTRRRIKNNPGYVKQLLERALIDEKPLPRAIAEALEAELARREE